jgi:hypothetical protein
VWFFISSDSPDDHKFIKNREKEYIAQEISDEFSETPIVK